MARIETEGQYRNIAARIEEILRLTGNEKLVEPKLETELEMLGNLMADYEEEHEPIAAPTLSEALRYRMNEMNLNQEGLARLLKVSQSRISDYLTGKSEPTLKVAREIHRCLNIDSDIILGIR